MNKFTQLQINSNEMADFINSLTKDDYASLASIFIIGRSGWEHNYVDTPEYDSFINEQESYGITVTKKMLEDKFLTKEEKIKQINIHYQYELSSVVKNNNIYHHNWLSKKPNLISDVTKGLKMLNETR